MSSERCVAGIGEVLMDLFDHGEATVGGAPFNVVFHLNQIIKALSAGEAFFLSAIGRDEWGHKIRSSVATAGISTRYLAEVDHPTGTALVFEQDGGAGFEIQSNVAWDFIQLEPSALELAGKCEAVVFGSLGQRSELSRESIQRFVAQVKGHRLYDVNLRRNTRSGSAGYSAEIIAESLNLATLVKMNEAELEEVIDLLGAASSAADPDERMLLRMEWLCKEYSLDAATITRGSKGACLFTEGRHLRLPDSTCDQALVHPVGAGDAFAAGLLFGMMQGWIPEQSVALANILSSFVVQQISATPDLPETVLSQVRALAAADKRGQEPNLLRSTAKA
jgi:fructokinase